MKKDGLIHPELLRVLAELGHGHEICLADAGLPIPHGVQRIDLAYRLGAPPFLDVLDVLAQEMVVEEFTVADEAETQCPDVVAAIRNAFPDAGRRTVSHEDFKVATGSIRAIVRTGETTPYANVILRSGVPFG